MPAVENTPTTAHGALIAVCNDIEQSGQEASGEDLAYIKAVLQDVVVDAMFQSHDAQQKPMDPADPNATNTVNHLLDQIAPEQSRDADVGRLFEILADPDLQGVLLAHDEIARKSFEPLKYPYEPEEPFAEPYAAPHVAPEDDSPYRIVGVSRAPNEPLGITVANENGSKDLTVIRIAANSAVDRQGVLTVGDVILEVNDCPVSTPEDLGHVIRTSNSSDVRFKVMPVALKQTTPGNQRFLKAHFSYSPYDDNRLKNKNTGLEFGAEDILQILDDSKSDWWECRNLTNNRCGMVPSPSFEERRGVQINNKESDKTKSSFLCGLGGKKKKKQNTSNPPSAQTERPAVLYEEVIRASPFHHKCLVLVGAQGVGRRSIKMKLIQSSPQEYGMAIASTSRPQRPGEVDGMNYHFRSKDEMNNDIKSNRYLEFGELNGNFYGTAFSALESVMKNGQTCIVDPKSTALSKLRVAQWLPYVVFIKPTSYDALKQMNSDAINTGVDTPKKTDDDIKRIMDETRRINKQFIHLCDTVVDFENFDATCRKIQTLFDRANTSPQWVPASWSSAVSREPFMDN